MREEVNYEFRDWMKGLVRFCRRGMQKLYLPVEQALERQLKRPSVGWKEI